MSVDDEYNVAARYRAIRKHLDNLGYRQALSLDGLPLIEKLLADLIQTTDSLKHFKTIAHDNVEACGQLQLSIDPYKCDNARLVQECNRLHSDLIAARETHVSQSKDLKRKAQKLESECGDLQSASSRNLKRIKELEAESSRKSKRIQELLGKCCKPLINNVGLASKKRPVYPLRRPSLESDPLPRTKSNSSLPSLSKVEPRVVDLLAMADRKMNTLNQEVTRLKGELDLQVDSVYTMKTQLAIKDKEILRLRKMLEGGRPYSAVSLECSCKKSDQYDGYDKNADIHSVCRKISESTDLRVLQQVKSDLEQQLREALDKQHDAMSQAMKLAERNEELEKELRDIDHIALAVEADCNSAVKENNKRVSQLQEKLESVMTQVHVLEGELMVERRSGQEMRADLEGARLENRNLQRKLDSTLDEKKHMTDRINELTVIEHSLKAEIERQSRVNENLKQEIVRLDSANSLMKKKFQSDVVSPSVKEASKRLKENGEKNHRIKEKTLTTKKSASRGQRRSHSPPVHEKQTETVRRHGHARDEEVTRDSNIEVTKMQKSNSDKEAKITQLQQTIDQVQTDRDFYKNEYNKLRERSVKNSEADNAELWGQVCELRRQLIDKEHAFIDLQREKKELSREKFELELRLKSSRSDRRNTYHPCGQCRPVGSCSCSVPAPLAGGDSKASAAAVERLERDRATALADVDRLVEERDSLRERLKLALEAHKFEQRRLRENLCEVETRLKKLERERQDLLVAQGTHRATIDGFEDQLEDLRDELRKTKQELSTQRTQYFQLRTLQDQADQALGDVQGQLNHAESELFKCMERNRLLEQQRNQVDNDAKALKQEISSLRGNMNRGDQEKDQLLMELQEKNGRIGTLERELKTKEQELSEAEQQSQELQHKYQVCVDQSAEQERRLRNMQMEMEIHQRQLAAASTDRDNAAQENRRLQDDLAAVTCEIRTLQRELEASRAESYDLKRQLQTYVSEVRRAEELINRKENERTDMLNHFRSLSLEATMLENNNHSLESEAAEARGALQSARDRSLDLERQLADRDCLIRGYETQIAELTQTVASMETQIRQQLKQRQCAEADLNAVRDLCVKLDQQKETLAKELGEKEATKAQYEAQLARLKAEQNMVQDQLNRDNVTVERLESLLDQARQESMDSQTANQELQCEITRLKQRICELQNKLSSECAELRRYQNQAAEYSKQISELRRQVTNERFDRARKEEEHRRNCQCGESGSSKRHENFLGGASGCPGAPKRLDSSVPHAIGSGSSSRFAQSGEEYRPRGDLRIEAQRTNRFNVSKAPSTSCKCSESNSKILNPDSLTPRAEQLRAQVSTIADTVSLMNEQARRGSSNCGGLCVQATVEEDNEYKDIRVKISDASGLLNVNGNNKTAVVKFCTPIVCKETMRLGSSTNQTTQMRTERSLSLPQNIETPNSKGDQYSWEEGTNVGRNEAHSATLTTKINKALRSLNCKGNNTRADRDESKIEDSNTMDSSTESKSVPRTEDEGYETSKMRNTQSRSSGDTKIISKADLSEAIRLSQERAEDDEQADAERNRPRIERSRSVPRGRSRDCECEVVRSNMSFPVRVDYSGATLTAADLTRPEFVQALTEIKENTRDLEQHLSQMNRAMRSIPLDDTPSESNNERRTDDNSSANRDSGTIEHFHHVASDSRDGIPGKSKKSKKNRRERDESSQSDSYEIHRMATSTPEKPNYSEAKRAEVNFVQENVNFEKIHRDVGTSSREIINGSCENIRFSKNGIYYDSAGSNRGPTTVDEAITARPSKIHKLKRSAVSPTNESTGGRTKINDENFRRFDGSEKHTRPSSLPRCPARMHWSSTVPSHNGSLIPMRQGARTKPRSAPARSTSSRIAAGSSASELPRPVRATSPVGSEYRRERSPTRLSMRRISSRSSSSSQTRRTSRSPTRSAEVGPRTKESQRIVSLVDSRDSHTLHDTFDASGGRRQARSGIVEREKPRLAPKALSFGMSGKSTKERDNEIARRPAVGESEYSSTTDTRGTSREQLRNGWEKKKKLSEQPRSKTPEAPRALDKNGNNGRSVSNNSSPTRRSAKINDPEIVIGDESASTSGTASRPVNHSRNIERKEKSSPINHPTNNRKLARVGPPKVPNNSDPSNFNSVYNNDGKSKNHQRSKSDSRESRDNVDRGSR